MTIPNVLASRYASAEMVELWSAERKIILERELWLAVLDAQTELGVEVVYQDLALCDNLTVTENMFLGREETNGFGMLSAASMQRQAAETMRSLAVTTLSSVDQSVARLSGGQRQSVAVAKAVMWNSKAVILDEPTAALGVAQTRQVLDLVRRLAERGLERDGDVLYLARPSPSAAA